MNENIVEAIKSFIEEHQGILRSRINTQSKIEEDLGITGDDAIEMLIAFGKKFNVDVSHFMAAEYFNAEGTSWIMPTYTPNKKVLTVTHLEKAIIAGKLDESLING